MDWKRGQLSDCSAVFKGSHDWSKLRWLLIKQQLGVNLSGTWLIIGDEVIVAKSGKQTHGLDKFYSSIQNQPVKALCFLNLSLAHVETRNSYPMITEQLIREDVKKTAPKAFQPKASKGKYGRPKGSTNKNRTEVLLSPFQTQLQGCIRRALGLGVI